MITALINANIIEVQNGSVIENGTLAMERGRIVFNGKSEKWNQFRCEDKKVELFDLKGKYVLPGLINMHDHLYHRAFHRGRQPRVPGVSYGDFKKVQMARPCTDLLLMAARDALVQLSQGFTTLRDCGTLHGISYALRQAIHVGILPGPRLFICGHSFVMTGGHGYKTTSITVDGCDGLKKAVREEVGKGADFIKIKASGSVATEPERGIDAEDYTFKEVVAVVEESHRLGKKVAAHADGRKGIQNSLRAGIDFIEHGLYLNEELIDNMLEQGTYLVPTLSGRSYISQYEESVGRTEFAKYLDEVEVKPNSRSLASAIKAGVKVLAGSDTCGHLIRELELFTEHSMSNADAIRSATSLAAESIGLASEIGTLEVGKSADVFVVDRNPLMDIHALRNVKAVYFKGNKVAYDDFYKVHHVLVRAPFQANCFVSL